MARKISIDQAGAWIISVALTTMIMGGGAFLIMSVTRKMEHAQKEELKAHQDSKEKQHNPTDHDEHAKHEAEKKTDTHDEKSKSHGAHWSYDGPNGPEQWGFISPEYAACQSGETQSPIDILEASKNATLPKIGFSYVAADLALKNNGHTLIAEIPKGSFINVAGKRYDLKQFHFHTPSEHYYKGVPYAMEVHLVHQDSAGQLLVVGVFIDEGSPANSALEDLWHDLPEKKDGKAKVALVNPEKLLPKNKGYYSYNGSLTTPPCSEGVKWVVMKDTIQFPKDQLDKFVYIFKDNARPVQPINERELQETRF